MFQVREALIIQQVKPLCLQGSTQVNSVMFQGMGSILLTALTVLTAHIVPMVPILLTAPTAPMAPTVLMALMVPIALTVLMTLTALMILTVPTVLMTLTVLILLMVLMQIIAICTVRNFKKHLINDKMFQSVYWLQGYIT